MNCRKKNNRPKPPQITSSTNLLFKLLETDPSDIGGHFMEFLTVKDKNTLNHVSRDIHGPLKEPARYLFARMKFNKPALAEQSNENKSWEKRTWDMYKFSITNREYGEIPYLAGILPFLIVSKLADQTLLTGSWLKSSVMGGLGFVKGIRLDYQISNREDSKPGMKLALTLEEQAREEKRQ